MAFADIYLALERGIADCAVTVGFLAHAQRWYEVTDYMIGPLPSQPLNAVIVNRRVWELLPSDIQQILIEEGARHELEAIRLTSAWNEVWIQRNIDAGLEFVEFSLDIRARNFQAARESVIPGWLLRMGYPSRNQNTVAVFNYRVGPIVGLRIEPDGTVVTVPITEGPHAGKTMEQVLAE